jgi:hypothetical protein
MELQLGVDTDAMYLPTRGDPQKPVCPTTSRA